MKNVFCALILTMLSSIALAAPSPIIFSSVCASGAYNLASKSCLAAGGAGGTGAKDTVAFYNHATGVLDYSANLRLSTTKGMVLSSLETGSTVANVGSTAAGPALVLGTVGGVSTILSATGKGDIACGYSLSNGQISAQGDGSIACGLATNSGIVATEHDGSFAFGTSDGASSQLSANGYGTWAIGIVAAGGNLGAVGDGNHVWGYVTGASSVINTDAAAHGAEAMGYVTSAGNLDGIGNGSTTRGYASGSGNISAGGAGALAMGRSLGSGNLDSNGNGSAAYGYCSAGTLLASGDGSTAFGKVTIAGSQVEATGDGSLAFGVASASTIKATNLGSLAFGAVENTSMNILASAQSSMAGGYPIVGPVVASGVASIAYGDGITGSGRGTQSFGIGQSNDSYLAMSIGRYADNLTGTATPGSWVATDPLFTVGIGTGTGARANAFRVLKNGNVYISGALNLDGASGAGSVQALQYRMGAANGDFTWSQGQVGTADKVTIAHTGFPAMGIVMTSENLLVLPARTAASTPTNPVAGALALTSGYKLCVYNGSAWKNASDGSTACSF